MTGRPKAKSSWAARFCARLAIALCFALFGLGDAFERGLGAHLGPDAQPTVAASLDVSGSHVDGKPSGGADKSGALASHGCHGCASMPQPMRSSIAIPVTFSAAPAWAATPSADGREPLVDLPPPRA